jgi:hypothetical protein
MSEQLALWHFNGADGSQTFLDSSLRANHPLAFGDAALSSANPRFGPTSAFFDGAGDYIKTPVYAPTPSTGSLLGTGVSGFLVAECWALFTDSSVLRTIFGLWNTATPAVGWVVERNGANKLNLFIGNNSLGFNRITGTTTITQDAHHHIALTRDAAGFKLWLDGVQQGSTYSGDGGTGGSQSSDYSIDLAYVLMGAYFNTSGGTYNEFMRGRIDEFQLSFRDAKYSGPFTPTGPFPDPPPDYWPGLCQAWPAGIPQ